VIEGAWDHRGFYLNAGEGADSVIEGFTIQRFVLDHIFGLNARGGGIYCEGASPTITNNVISNNYAYWGGGGIYCEDASAPLIMDNTLIYNEGVDGGGAIRCRTSSPVITGNIIKWNDSGDGDMDTYGNGGGIAADGDSSPTIANNIIEGNEARGDPHGPTPDGGGIYCSGNAIIIGNTIAGNIADMGSGGGIDCKHSAPRIAGNIITGNRSGSGGGGLFAWNSICDIRNNFISENVTRGSGGGVYASDALLINNIIINNTAETYGDCYGGGIFCRGYMSISNCTISGNTAIAGEFGDYESMGGGICCDKEAFLDIFNTILWNNLAEMGEEIFLDAEDDRGAHLTILFSDVDGGQDGVEMRPGSTMTWGDGMIDTDPLFAAGPSGDFYLGQIGAGQGADSPCVNSGYLDASAFGLDILTTRTDHVPDLHQSDMGFHYDIPGTEPEPDTVILSGPRETVNPPTIAFTYTGIDDRDPPSALRFSYCLDGQAWTYFTHETTVIFPDLDTGLHTFQVRALDTDGNIDPIPAVRTFFMESWEPGDGWNFFVTGPGPGALNPPLVRTPLNEWLAYGVNRYGVNVACGDVDGLDMDDVITGPGPGKVFGPHVRGWEADGTPLPGLNFFAYRFPEIRRPCGGR